MTEKRKSPSTPPRKVIFISLFPEFISTYLRFGCLEKGFKAGVFEAEVLDLRSFAAGGRVDERPYGGGDSMVLRVDVLAKALDALKEQHPELEVIYPSAKGQHWTQPVARKTADSWFLSEDKRPLVFVCGRYGGVDQRFIDLYVSQEICIGPYILAGGELPSLVILESTVRLVEDVLGNAASPLFDSYSTDAAGNEYLEEPLYTKPREFRGLAVPEVLLSGDHAKIEKWRKATRKPTQNTQKKDRP